MSGQASRSAGPVAAHSASVTGLRLRAYAKVNLGLEILGRRSDGYHEIVSVTQTISLADDLTATPSGPFEIQMHPPIVGTEENIARRAAEALAAEALAAEAGLVPSGRLSIRKHIPLAAGLGGGSSDAAAALRLLDRLWQTRLGAPRLAELGAALGSDVPLFLGAATSLIRGRGEFVEPLTAPPPFWLVLVVPSGSPPDKTRAMYRALSPSEWSDGVRTLALAERMRAGAGVVGAPIVNGFDAAADRTYPGFAALRARLTALLGASVHLTGAGPTLFATFEDAESARQAARRARGPGLGVFVCRSVARRPTIRATGPALTR